MIATGNHLDLRSAARRTTPKVSGMSGGLPRRFAPRNDRCFRCGVSRINYNLSVERINPFPTEE